MKFVCSLYGIEEKGVKGIENARHSLHVKDKRDIEMLPPIHNALELHITRPCCQSKILFKQTMQY